MTAGRLDTQLPRGLIVTPLLPTERPAAQPQAAPAVGRVDGTAADGATANGATANGATARIGRLPVVPVAAAAVPPATSGTATAAQHPQPAQAPPQAQAQTAAAPPATGTTGTAPGSSAAPTAGLTPVQVSVVPLTPR